LSRAVFQSLSNGWLRHGCAAGFNQTGDIMSPVPAEEMKMKRVQKSNQLENGMFKVTMKDQIEHEMLALMQPLLDECAAEYQANGRVLTAYMQNVQNGWRESTIEAKYRAGLIEDYRKLAATAAKYPKGAEYREYIESQMHEVERWLSHWNSDVMCAMGNTSRPVDALINRLLAE
jgi:hypothetical protein